MLTSTPHIFTKGKTEMSLRFLDFCNYDLNLKKIKLGITREDTDGNYDQNSFQTTCSVYIFQVDSNNLEWTLIEKNFPDLIYCSGKNIARI